jgi:predicted nucleic acid-binding protein
MMRVFVDSDVILDCVMGRRGFVDSASAVLSLSETSIIQGMTSSLVLANCHYVLARQAGAAKSREVIAKLRTLLQVCSVGDRELEQALVSDFEDLEDGIQFFVATNHGAQVIVTRNSRDYQSSSIPVMTPLEFLASRMCL